MKVDWEGGQGVYSKDTSKSKGAEKIEMIVTLRYLYFGNVLRR